MCGSRGYRGEYRCCDPELRDPWSDGWFGNEDLGIILAASESVLVVDGESFEISKTASCAVKQDAVPSPVLYRREIFSELTPRFHSVTDDRASI